MYSSYGVGSTILEEHIIEPIFFAIIKFIPIGIGSYFYAMFSVPYSVAKVERDKTELLIILSRH